ncbi:TlpA family protein disulfide reductase [Microbacterium sp. DT81.1]|uniref:TlpA family protein disulfide reductase n=1 Tax=Microbacterium sp. DT81.1 TaxID=3393413 RepID=UPI003CFAF102
MTTGAFRPRRALAFRRHATALATTAVLLLAGTGCAADDLAGQYRDGTNKGYISGDGRIVEIPAGERGDAVEFEGVTENGTTVTSDQYREQVLVVNFWYAACGPCRVEAPHLQAVYEEFAGAGADFLGINTYDQPATASSFAETYGITYPSVIDVENGAAKLAFAQVAPVQATPTTLVLDQQGRVAARISGPIDSPSTLRTIVKDLIQEGQ